MRSWYGNRILWNIIVSYTVDSVCVCDCSIKYLTVHEAVHSCTHLGLEFDIRLKNNLLTAILCHQNTAAVAVNSIASLGWKSMEMAAKYEILWAITQRCITILHFNPPLWVDHLQKASVICMIVVTASSVRQDFGLQKGFFVCQEQTNSFQKFLMPP